MNVFITFEVRTKLKVHSSSYCILNRNSHRTFLLPLHGASFACYSTFVCFLVKRYSPGRCQSCHTTREFRKHDSPSYRQHSPWECTE